MCLLLNYNIVCVIYCSYEKSSLIIYIRVNFVILFVLTKL